MHKHRNGVNIAAEQAKSRSNETKGKADEQLNRLAMDKDRM